MMMTPAIKSEVATGRWINGSEIFTGGGCPVKGHRIGRKKAQKAQNKRAALIL
jgi:hypothetical protein